MMKSGLVIFLVSLFFFVEFYSPAFTPRAGNDEDIVERLVKKNLELERKIGEYEDILFQRELKLDFSEKAHRTFLSVGFQIGVEINPDMRLERMNEILTAIWDWSREFKIDPWKFYAKVIIESNGLKNVTSKKGARGYGQVIPDTAWRMHKILLKKGYNLPYRTQGEVTKALIEDPVYNIMLSVYFTSTLDEKFNRNWYMSRIAYLGGEKSVSLLYLIWIDRVYEELLVKKSEFLRE